MTAHATLSTILALSWGPWEIAIVIGAILLLFGGWKLPELARSLGKAFREFRSELHGQGDNAPPTDADGSAGDGRGQPPSQADDSPSTSDRDKPAGS